MVTQARLKALAKKYWWLIAIVVITIAVWRFYAEIKAWIIKTFPAAAKPISDAEKAVGGVTGGGTGGTGTGGTSGGSSGAPSPATPTYPVTVNSAPADILKALEDSGYTAALQNSIDQGIYDASYLTDMQRDPREWLRTHTYLYTDYPTHFRAV